MKAQIKKGGKIFTGRLASILVKKGVAKEVRAKRAEPKEQSEPIKKVNKPVKKTVKKK